ncbi:hypothetical protein [Marinospirillum perlucidum]|uniref:hypothetical protein n=1 Tax=Marinospirillum perlucidum TaxID=1982602 RepID=UPI000DF3CB98|nr:hypothetical protein [Marinospirillum perlucidum]
MDKEESVYRASILLVKHFQDCLEREGLGLHSRIFNFILHPEFYFVGVGESQEVIDGEPAHPEHIVPCAVLIEESCKLIKQGVSTEKIAGLLSKHWKIGMISKRQASYIDSKCGLGLKNKMPEDWSFETGNTYERLKLANIELKNFK